MTAMPEARRAREAELPDALLGMVTDYDSWRSGEAGVEASEVMAVMQANVALAGKVLRRFLATLPHERERSPIDQTLDHAIMTAKAQRDPVLVAKLDAIAGRVLR
ncbi:MAG: S-methyl-5'-thioadenosine phosphorylase, partial [Novosphingobium sp.]